MMPIRRMYPCYRRKTAGVGLVTAIFLLVVLAGLALAMVNVSNGQQASSAMDTGGARVYQAARAGIEWGAYQQLQQDSCQGLTTFVLPAETLKMFSVTVECRYAPTPSAGPGASLAATLASTLTKDSVVVTDISTTGLVAGMRISGTGVAPGTRILSIDTTTTLTMTTAALINATAQLLRYRSSLDRWQITSTACSQPGANGCPNSTPDSVDYIQRRLQVEF